MLTKGRGKKFAYRQMRLDLCAPANEFILHIKTSYQFGVGIAIGPRVCVCVCFHWQYYYARILLYAYFSFDYYYYEPFINASHTKCIVFKCIKAQNKSQFHSFIFSFIFFPSQSSIVTKHFITFCGFIIIARWLCYLAKKCWPYFNLLLT